MKERPLITLGTQAVLSLPTETQFTSNGVVSRTLFATANERVVLFGFSEGQELSEHTSTAHVLVQILSGRCEFTLGGETHSLEAGHLLYLPPKMPHAVRATEAFSMLLTMMKPEAVTRVLTDIKATPATAS